MGSHHQFTRLMGTTQKHFLLLHLPSTNISSSTTPPALHVLLSRPSFLRLGAGGILRSHHRQPRRGSEAGQPGHRRCRSSRCRRRRRPTGWPPACYSHQEGRYSHASSAAAQQPPAAQRWGGLRLRAVCRDTPRVGFARQLPQGGAPRGRVVGSVIRWQGGQERGGRGNRGRRGGR